MISSTPHRSRGLSFAFVAICLGYLLIQLSACSEEYVPDEFEARSDHEAYYYSLAKAGLTETALARDWMLIAKRVLRHPVQTESPLEEIFYLDPTRADAVAYRFPAKRGHKVQIDVDMLEETDGRLFVDLYRTNAVGEALHVATASDAHTIAFEPRRDAHYVLRIQSELLRGGSYKVRVLKVPAFDFPVAGSATKDIGSFFGDPRDGGRRKHHGVDIFAPKGTPILAPTSGYIRFTGERGLGGRVVWMHDEQRDQSLYFAHLDEILTRRHTFVRAGDTLGTVGNTGNARRTPPHLHFGIYKNGPIDPYYFVAEADREPEPVEVGVDLLSAAMRTRKSVPMRQQFGGNAKTTLQRHQLVTVRGARGNALRVELPDGRSGYISMSAIEDVDEALTVRTLPVSAPLRAIPDAERTPINTLQPGARVDVLAHDGSFQYVRSGVGQTGWISSR